MWYSRLDGIWTPQTCLALCHICGDSVAMSIVDSFLAESAARICGTPACCNSMSDLRQGPTLPAVHGVPRLWPLHDLGLLQTGSEPDVQHKLLYVRRALAIALKSPPASRYRLL